MAIDTAAKRASVMHIALPAWSVLPIPDASVGDGDKLHLLRLYAGIALGELVSVVTQTRIRVSHLGIGL